MLTKTRKGMAMGQAGVVNAGRAREGTGLAGWLLDFFDKPLRARFAGLGRVRPERRMAVVETLGLGGKRQLMLVECDEARFLVMVGEGAGTIVEMRVGAAAAGAGGA